MDIITEDGTMGQEQPHLRHLRRGTRPMVNAGRAQSRYDGNGVRKGCEWRRKVVTACHQGMNVLDQQAGPPSHGLDGTQ